MLFKKKSRQVAERTAIHDQVVQNDPMRSQIPQVNQYQPVSFAAGVRVPADLQSLLDRIEAEIDTLHQAGGLDAGVWQFQDAAISALLAPWHAARYEEYKRSVHAAEELFNQAEANVEETILRAVSLEEKIAQLEQTNAKARAIVTGAPVATRDLTSAKRTISTLLGRRGLETAVRVGDESEATDTLSQADFDLLPGAAAASAGLAPALHLLPAMSESRIEPYPGGSETMSIGSADGAGHQNTEKKEHHS